MRARGIEGNHGGTSPRRQCHPLVYIATLLPRQSSRDNANNGRGGPAWPARRLISSSIKEPGDVLQTAMRHATHPPPVKTFRTTAAVPVCHDDGVSHVPPFVFLGTALGNYKVQRMQFLGTKDRTDEPRFVFSRGTLEKIANLYHRIFDIENKYF